MPTVAVPRRSRRTPLRLLVLVALVATILVGTARPAQARAVGITDTRIGILRMVVEGDGVYAHQITGELITGRWTCNIEFRIFGTGRDGRYWQSDSKVAGCGAPFVHADWERAFQFAPNTNACMKVGISGRGWEPTYACVRIKP